MDSPNLRANRILVLAISFFIVSSIGASIVSGVSDCPANRATFGAYNKITVLPKFKIVNQPLTIMVVKVDDKTEMPLRRSVEIEFKGEDGAYRKISTIQTGSNGIAPYTPENIGMYRIKSSGKIVSFEVHGSTIQIGDATCGNEICEDGENPDNCPEDCTECGDAICEGPEDKDSCPDDCEICGDGICDPSEYDRGQCYCVEDCIVCGDDFCDKNYGEDETCPEDCGGTTGQQDGSTASRDFISDYWWLLAIIILSLLFIIVKPLIRKVRMRKKKAKKKAIEHIDKTWTREEKLEYTPEDDVEIEEIILGLMDSGVPEKRILKKMGEFGLDKKEAKEIMDKAKKLS